MKNNQSAVSCPLVQKINSILSERVTVLNQISCNSVRIECFIWNTFQCGYQFWSRSCEINLFLNVNIQCGEKNIVFAFRSSWLICDYPLFKSLSNCKLISAFSISRPTQYSFAFRLPRFVSTITMLSSTHPLIPVEPEIILNGSLSEHFLVWWTTTIAISSLSARFLEQITLCSPSHNRYRLTHESFAECQWTQLLNRYALS